jgi:hypothetical protein
VPKGLTPLAAEFLNLRGNNCPPAPSISQRVSETGEGREGERERGREGGSTQNLLLSMKAVTPSPTDIDMPSESKQHKVPGVFNKLWHSSFEIDMSIPQPDATEKQDDASSERQQTSKRVKLNNGVTHALYQDEDQRQEMVSLM